MSEFYQTTNKQTKCVNTLWLRYWEQLIDMNSPSLMHRGKGEWHLFYFIEERKGESSWEWEMESSLWLLDPQFRWQHTHPEFSIKNSHSPILLLNIDLAQDTVLVIVNICTQRSPAQIAGIGESKISEFKYRQYDLEQLTCTIWTSILLTIFEWKMGSRIATQQCCYKKW